ncbi:MAG: GyrI-like domain-containing protein [Bacillota bacterium]|nr:GyrI-like domain-containing protein [Bacillota bacterium]
MEKMDYKKEYKDLYVPSNKKPVLIDVPEMKFVMVDGCGDPNNNPEFEKSVEALYSVSYAIKMLPKKGIVPEGYIEYVVPPLEGLWWIEGSDKFSFTERENWRYTLMIRQPEFVTAELFQQCLMETKRKKNNEKLEEVGFESFTEGLCVQMMHIGPYATEPETKEVMENFLTENARRDETGAVRKHHEIYLSDPRKGDPEKRKTVLRIPVK